MTTLSSVSVASFMLLALDCAHSMVEWLEAVETMDVDFPELSPREVVAKTSEYMMLSRKSSESCRYWAAKAMLEA